MSEQEKIEFVQAMLSENPPSDSITTTYLALSKQRILNRLYPLGNGDETIPGKYDLAQCELAVRMIARKGGEGEISHNENGISRTYENANDEDILSEIVQTAGVI